MAKFINHNGKIISASFAFIKHKNRSFRYGDGFFETIKVYENKILFFSDHFLRISKGLQLLKLNCSRNFNKEYLELQIQKTFQENKSKNCLIRISFYRCEGGKYTPVTNDMSFLIEIAEDVESAYPINENGLKLGLFKDIFKPVTILSELKSCNALLFVLAGIFCKETGIDDCIIQNQYGNATEVVSSNIFIINKGKIFTPPLSEGCVAGVMRKNVIKICKNNSLEIQEKPLSINEFDEANEVFITNIAAGIRWMKNFKNTSYENSITKELSRELNKTLF